jgi:hypothetical protein
LAVAVLAGLTLLAVWHLGGARRELLLARRELRASRQALSQRDDASATASLDRAAGHLRAARASASSPPLAVLAAVPVAGGPVRASLAAVRAGLDGVEAGRLLVGASSSFPTSAGAAVDGQDLSAFRAAAVRSQAAMVDVDRRLAHARAVLDGPSGAALPPVSGPARAMRAEVDRSRAQVAGLGRGLNLLVDLTGPTTEARLLLLSQDSLELRATGGYIGSYGVLHFSHGTVKLEKYEATEDLPAPDPPVTAPLELSRHLPRFWGLSNANWWPDFPTSAAAAGEMFRRQGGGDVDGVLALTELATARLLGALGPVQLPSYPKPVTEAGFDRRVVYEVELKRPPDEPRKKFLVELSNVVFDHLFHLPDDRLPAVADAFRRSIGTGDVQLWFADAGRQRQLAGTVVAGQLPRTDGDVLMVVDANMTASKANLDVRKVVDYRVERGANGRMVGHVRVEVHDDGSKSSINRFYDGYLRIYAPAGARLLHPVGAQEWQHAADGPFEVFSQEVVAVPNGSAVATFDYELPERVGSGGRYRLTWVRQAGTPADRLRVDVAGTSAQLDAGARSSRLERNVAR